jgi:diketogulonate reductase-like aldo/keto reductase
MSVTAYYAMAKGKVLDDLLLAEIAAQHGRSIVQVVLRWLVQQEGVVALSKTVSEERAAANAAIFDFHLSEAQMAAIDELGSRNGRLLNPSGLAMEWD